MPAPQWTLRPASEDDREFLFELNKVAMGPYVAATWGWDEDEQIAFFDARFDPARHQIVRVAEADVGVLEVEERPDEIHLARIALLPEWQGRGIGSSIIASILRRAAESGRSVTLRVLQRNPRAITLYEALGFTVTGQSDTHVFMRVEPLRGEADAPGR